MFVTTNTHGGGTLISLEKVEVGSVPTSILRNCQWHPISSKRVEVTPPSLPRGWTWAHSSLYECEVPPQSLLRMGVAPPSHLKRWRRTHIYLKKLLVAPPHLKKERGGAPRLSSQRVEAAHSFHYECEGDTPFLRNYYTWYECI